MDHPDQSEVVAFLGRAASYGPATERVERVATHASLVFLAGTRAYKLKRAVRYRYLDYSTRELRRRACEAELALNRRTAPALYLGVTPVTREADGGLALGGTGEALDWLVVMRRLGEGDLFDRLAEAGRLTAELALALTRHIVAFHEAAERRYADGGTRDFAALIVGNDFNLRVADAGLPTAAIDLLRERSSAALTDLDSLLDRRRDAGYVRRCHGDLHLGNICLLDGEPALFDAIEFSDAIACIDVLYDLAFLLMDLEHRGLRAMANLVFNRYLDLAEAGDGLAALPLFLSARAAIRAHVAAAAARLAPDPAQRAERQATAAAYLERALAALAPPPPRLVAIGGLSGSGKSTLAAALAPGIGGAPGARVLRSDILRKRLFGVAPETPLPSAAYDPSVTQRVYEALGARAAAALKAGHSVVVDAVFAQPQERRDIAALAEAAQAPFSGLWIEAPRAAMAARLAARRGDASDATPAVLEVQLGYDLGAIDWRRLDGHGSVGEVAAAARAMLGL
jgi:aminoglycoside phosphotransferase family enzyme/predicted kinase